MQQEAYNLFSLIVKDTTWGQGQECFPKAQAFKLTTLKNEARFRPYGIVDIDALSKLPTIFTETKGQTARIGYIISGRALHNDLLLKYAYDDSIEPLNKQDISSLAKELDITAPQLNCPHWSVRDGDLFRALLHNIQPRRSYSARCQSPLPNPIDPTIVSVAIPHYPTLTPLYETIKQVALQCGLQCHRTNSIWDDQIDIQDVVSLIINSCVVICDCRGHDPDVLYQIGIAHSLGRKVILITQALDDIPQALKHIHCVQYLNNREGLTQLSARLKQYLAPQL